MQILTVVDNEITWNDKIFIYQGFEKIDTMMVHVIMDNGYYAFIGGDTEINGVVQVDADAIIATLTA
jgi:hypothetical protein